MGFSCGIVGLPNVGKSTLFNALTAAGAPVANYPFCTIDPNVGVVEVPDVRLDWLSGHFKSRKKVPTTIEFVDIAGLVKGANQGEGLGNKFLANIRDVEAIAHIVRCFEDPDIVHVTGTVDPARDIDTIETELILADLDTAEKRLAATEKKAKASDKKAAEEAAFLKRVVDNLGAGRPVRSGQYSAVESIWLHECHLITDKPVLYVANVAESDLSRDLPAVQEVQRLAERDRAPFVVISAKVEAELAELSADERAELLESLGLKESGLDRLARAGYQLLGLITFFTAGEPESRAWTVRRGAKAPEAAGRIHSDMERGFIRAEVMAFDDLVACGSPAVIRERGLLRVEGRDYVVQDGDILYIRFQG